MLFFLCYISFRSSYLFSVCTCDCKVCFLASTFQIPNGCNCFVFICFVRFHISLAETCHGCNMQFEVLSLVTKTCFKHSSKPFQKHSSSHWCRNRSANKLCVPLVMCYILSQSYCLFSLCSAVLNQTIYNSQHVVVQMWV